VRYRTHICDFVEPIRDFSATHAQTVSARELYDRRQSPSNRLGVLRRLAFGNGVILPRAGDAVIPALT
jgi:hypothetical protein